jgi:hypothetical protein
VYGIHQQASFALGIKADAVHRIMLLKVILVQPVNVTYTCLEPMVPITDEKHMTTKKAEVRV